MSYPNNNNYQKDDQAYMLENTYFQIHKQDNSYILQNTYFQNHKRETGDFSPFYITVTICTLLFVFLIVLNITLGCCSRYSAYWVDRHTGNRWIVSLWTATPHKQPSLDYTELKDVQIDHPPATRPRYDFPSAPLPSYTPPETPTIVEVPAQQIKYSKAEEVIELQQQKRESAI